MQFNPAFCSNGGVLFDDYDAWISKYALFLLMAQWQELHILDILKHIESSIWELGDAFVYLDIHIDSL